MIPAADFDDLVDNCIQLLSDGTSDIVGVLVESICLEAESAALTVLAFYKAADRLAIDSREIDDIILVAEMSCDPSKVEAYRRVYNKFKIFEIAYSQVQKAAGGFFVAPSTLIH